jgi:hypothetical protein
MGLRHWGEYDHVLAKSSDAAALIALHETPCSEEEAIKILGWAEGLKPRRLLNDVKLPMRLYFMGNRGRAGTKMRRGHYRHHMSLPKGGGRRLRVGIVLHEYAHLVAEAGAKHNHEFVRILDELVTLFNAGAMPAEAVAAGPPIYKKHTPRGKCFRCGQQTTRKSTRFPGSYSCRACEWR